MASSRLALAIVLAAGCSQKPAGSHGDRHTDGADQDGGGDPGDEGGDPGDQGGDPGSGGGGGDDDGVAGGTAPDEPLVGRGGEFFGFDEQLNRYYTDPTWQPSRTRYVSRNGSGSGTSAGDPAAVQATLDSALPGDRIVFLKSATAYAGCYELDEDHSGTHDAPIVLYAERNTDGSRGVAINCCASGRETCINLEFASFVAVDGFELNGGRYGVRVVGGYAQADHVRGNAVLDCFAHDQDNDPFFTGGNDWFVLERNVGARAGTGDGHGIYLSNGSDWNIVRFNEVYDNESSDFQINADPASTCADEGIDYDDPLCDGPAGSNQGAGVSEFMHLEGNYFHDGRGQGANFTSVRNSVVRNNIFAFYERHGVSFWQETDNPNLGSSHNLIHHNLFIGNSDDQLLLFYNDSDFNDVRNNVIATLTIGASSATGATGVVALSIEESADSTSFGGNLFIGGYCAVYNMDFDEIDTCDFDPGDDSRADFSPSWVTDFPFDLQGALLDFSPTAGAPWRDVGALLADTPNDWDGTARAAPTDLGPVEVP